MANDLTRECEDIFFADQRFLCRSRPFEYADCRNCSNYITDRSEADSQFYRMVCSECGYLVGIPKDIVYNNVQNCNPIPCSDKKCLGEMVMTKFEINKLLYRI